MQQQFKKINMNIAPIKNEKDYLVTELAEGYYGARLTPEELVMLGYELIYLGGGLEREEMCELGNKTEDCL